MYFFVLEGVMVSVAVLSMNLFHPGFCLREAYHVNVRTKDTKSVDSELMTAETGGMFGKR